MKTLKKGKKQDNAGLMSLLRKNYKLQIGGNQKKVENEKLLNLNCKNKRY